MDKNKAKTAVSVAVEAKPEVEIWRRPKQYKSHRRQTDRWQTTDDDRRQTKDDTLYQRRDG